MAKKMSMRDRVRQKAQEKKDSSSFSNYLRFPQGKEKNMFKVKKETHYLDIVPYTISDKNHPVVLSDAKKSEIKEKDKIKVGDIWYSRPFWVHKDVGTGNDKKSYLCPSMNQGKPCPICEYASERKDQGADREELRAYRPKERWLLNVIDTKSDDKKPMVWDISYHLFGKELIKELTEEEEDNGGFADLEEGNTLKIRFEEKSMGKNNFWEADKITFLKRDKDYKESMLDKVYDLDELLVHSSYSTIESAFIMGEAVDEENQEEEEQHEEKRNNPKKNRKPEPEEEEENEKPSKPKRKREPEPEPEDDDSDADDDSDSDADTEEEPEEKPAPRSRRATPKREEKPKPKKKVDEDEDTCPAGAKFGKDFDKYEDCDTCKKVRACMKASKRDED